MRNVLVVSSSEFPDARLRAALGDDVGELHVVVPAIHQSRLQWLTNADDDARDRATQAADSIGAAVPSQETETTAGASDPVLAAEDALREFEADEIVFVTRPDNEANWLEKDSFDEFVRRYPTYEITRLVVSDQ